MAPKKKNQQKKSNPKPATKPDANKPAPKIQISAENERRLRQLLLNTDRPAAATSFSGGTGEAASRASKAKRLRSVYDKLSLEGFTSDQIELALSALNEGATFDAALDWLCLNLPGNELPLKFSSGAFSLAPEERSVKIVSTAQTYWNPPQNSNVEVEEEKSNVSIRVKVKKEEFSLDSDEKSSQADWIRQYMEQQAEEEEVDDWEEEADLDPNVRAASIVEEYHHAKLGAQEAKQKKDKKSQKHFGDIIRKLKQELSSLGLSDDILELTSQNECANLIPDEKEISSNIVNFENETGVTKPEDEATGSKNEILVPTTAEEFDTNDQVEEKCEESEMELDNLFDEDSCPLEQLPSEISKNKKKETATKLEYGSTVVNIDEIWKKGDSRSTPKAYLQKICQRLGWEAPKYSKLHEKENKYLYSVSILRPSTGRGKSRKTGGLISLQLPEQDNGFNSVEEAQNSVAAFSLCQLFPNLPLQQMLKEQYASYLENWQEDDFSSNMEDTENTRRADFVDSLLNSDYSQPVVQPESDTREVTYDSHAQTLEGSSPTRLSNQELAESDFLKKEHEKKTKLPKYMEMLKVRASLPIARLKTSFLEKLNENDVIVVCGETGCGKTTQVPQFILDDMIQSGIGGRCNIMCTQPRRIAAISVAERVSDERCESFPGSDDSLVGFQVRLESARNERTKLLFCTTGILLRKLNGNNELAGVTHVIVDEVHERSLLGDFLLVVLKNILKRQSSRRGPKLKVILMSATVDSTLFSKYFGNCPVIHAEGRTHPVSTYFLEDIYENMNYNLPSDSPASGAFMKPKTGKPGSYSVDNKRGKKNLVLSSWGDESILLDDYVNPNFLPNLYDSYSEQTRKNLKNLNEDVIDFDILEDLISFIDENYPAGAVLVFLPGVAEIDMLVDKLSASYRFGGESANWVLPLHSSLASTDQRKVFLSPPQNTRKVIVSTDIAETSITIDDVVYVVDCGRHKENRFNPQKKMSSMVEDWISRANAKQRRGRAGRVKPGICFCLYTRHRYEKLMRPFQVPEMLRMPLTELCLQIKSLALGDIKSFLTEAIEPPSEEAISSATDLLYKVGAFEGNEVLSSLGYHLAKLPVDVLTGKMMVYGAIFGCLSPILSVAAFLSYKFPFVYPKDEKPNVEKIKSSLLSENQEAGIAYEARQSDHLLLVVAYSRWAKILFENGAKAAQQFCRSFFINSSVMYMVRDMRIQFGSLLADIGLVNLPSFLPNNVKRKDILDNWFSDMSQPFNMYAHNSAIIKSVLCAGLYPNIAAGIEGIIGTLGNNKALFGSISAKDHPIWFDGRREVHIHPSSVNHSTRAFRYPFLIYLEKVETSKIFLRDTSVISPYAILLFGGSIVIQHQTGSVVIDNWLKLTAPAQTAVLFKELRVTLDAVLKDLIRKPKITTIASNEVVRSIIHLLLEEDKLQGS